MKILLYILQLAILAAFISALNKATVIAIIQQIVTVAKDLVHGQCDFSAMKTIALLVLQAIGHLLHAIKSAVIWILNRLPG